MSKCKLFSLDSQETLDEFYNLLGDSSGDLISDIQKLSDYISSHDKSIDTLSKASLIEGFLTQFYSDNFGEELDPKALTETVSNTLEGDTETFEPRANVVNTTNDVDVFPDFVVTNDLSDIFLSTSDQAIFRRTSKNKLIQTIFIGSDLVNSGGNSSLRYKFNQNDTDFNIAMQRLKQETLNRLIEYRNSKMQNKLEQFPMYTGTMFNKEPYDALITDLKRLFSEPLANNQGKWYSRSDYDTKAFYDYIFLTNFDNFIDTQFNGMIRIARGYFNTHELPLRANKYITDTQKHIQQDWNNSTSSMYDNMNQAVATYINSMEILDNNYRGTGEYMTTNNFQNIMKVIRESSANTYSWEEIRSNPYALNKIFRTIHNNKNGEKNRIFSGANKGLVNIFNTIYRNVFSDVPSSLYTIFNNMDQRVTQNDMYSMILSHINKMSPINYTQTVFNRDTNSYETVQLDSYNLSPKKRFWEDNIIVTAKNNANTDVFNKYNIKLNYDKGALSRVTMTLGTTNVIAQVSDIGAKKGITYRNMGREIKGPMLAELVKNNSEVFQEFFSDILNKKLDNTYWNNILNVATNDDFEGLLDLGISTILTYDIGKELMTDFGNTYNYRQAKNAVLSKYNALLNNKKETSYMQAEINMLKPGSMFRALKGIELLAKVTSIVNGDFRKSYVVDMDGGKLPKYRLTALMNDDKFLFYNNSLKKIFRNNIFNSSFGWDLGTALKTDFSNKNGDYKSTFKMNPTELLYSQFVGDYLSMLQNKRAAFQPLNFADKSNIWTKVIDMTKEINEKPLYSERLTPAEINDFHFTTMKSIFTDFTDNLTADYRTFFKNYNEMHEGEKGFKKYPENGALKTYQKAITELTLNEIIETINYIQEDIPDFKFISEVHFSPKGNRIGQNQTLNNWIDIYTARDGKKFSDMIEYQKKLYAYTLQANEVKFQTIDSDGVQNQLLVRTRTSFNENWMNNRLGEWINFKATNKKGEPVEVLTLENLEDVDVVLNPELDKFFEIDNLVTNHYVASTFGFPFIHPSKYKGNNLREDEASRTSAMYKRGVIAGATIHPFMKGNKNGVPNQYRIAIIQDNKFPVINIHAEDDVATVYDGGIWLDPMTAIWESKSLEDLKLSPVHRKPIGYVSQADYLSSMLLKCATFSINNELMRKSVTGEVNGEALFRTMSDHRWKDHKGDDIVDLDITRGNYLSFDNLYFIDNDLGKWRIKSIEKVEGVPNTYLRTKHRVDYVGNELNPADSDITRYGEILENGDIVEELYIDSNYSLWNALGGKNSMELYVSGANSDVRSLEYNEKSIELATQIANDVEISIGNGRTYQPMKYSNINYVANESGVKQGVTNINPLESLFSSEIETVKQLATSTMDIDFVGIQMNADHTVDDAEVSEPTQVLSALIQKGLSFDIANEVYQDIGETVYETLRENKFLETYDTDEARTELYKILGKGLLTAFGEDSDSLGLTEAYLSFVKDNINGNTLLSEQRYKIPFDDPNVFNKFYSGFISGINRDIIKRKYAGIGAVLNPSHDLITLFDMGDGTTATYDELIKKVNSREELERTLESLKTPIEAGEVRHGDIIEIVDTRTTREDGTKPSIVYRVGGYSTNDRFRLNYEIFNDLPTLIDALSDSFEPQSDSTSPISKAYYNFVNALGKNEKADLLALLETYNANRSERNATAINSYVRSLVPRHGRFRMIGLSEVKALRDIPEYQIVRRGDLGRNLRPQNTTVTINPALLQNTTATTFDLFDLDISRLSYEINNVLDSLQEDAITPIDPAYANTEMYTIYQEALNRINEKFGEDNMFLDVVKKFNNVKNNKSNESKELKAIYFGKVKAYLTELIQDDLQNLEENKLFRVPLRYRLNNDLVPVEYQNIPNEMMLGRPWATMFGLRTGDNVYEILKGGAYFFKSRLLEKNFTNSLLSEEFDFHAFSFNGNDVYIKAFNTMEDIDKYIASNQDKYTYRDIKTINSNGKQYRINSEGETLYRFEPSVMKMVTNEKGKEIILVQADSLMMLDSKEDFNYVNVSADINNPQTHNSTTREAMMSFITNGKMFDRRTKSLVEGDKFNTARYTRVINEIADELAQKMSISFNQALNFIVARIPAQSMQSFMNMRIAGFIESDTNITYVPIEQLVYQGSDYDIDKAYILGASINRQGVYYSWSPYFSFNSVSEFEASNNLPLPNRKLYTVSKANNELQTRYNEVAERLQAYNKTVENTFNSELTRANVVQNAKARERAIERANLRREQSLNSAEYLALLDESNSLDAELKKGNTNDITELVQNILFNDTPALMVTDNGFIVRDIARVAEFLNAVKDMNTNLITTLSTEVNEVVSQLINNHNSYKMSNRDRSEASKNRIYYNMWKIGQSVGNVVAQTSPITMGPARNRADNSTSGQYSKYLSNNNPGTRVIQQYQNSIGKDSIGITATGIKILSALLDYYHIKLNQSTPENIDRLRLQNGEANTSPTGNWTFTLNGKSQSMTFSPTLSNINWNKIKSEEFIDLLRAEQTVYNNVPEDVFLTISVLLSASTDNAKELILEKINASPDLAGTYIYMLIGGVDFSTAANFMTTPEVTAVALKSKSNILYNQDSNNSVQEAVKYFINGVDIKKFLPDAGVMIYLLENKYGDIKNIPWTQPGFSEVVRELGNIWITQNSNESEEMIVAVPRPRNEEEAASLEGFDPADIEGKRITRGDIIQLARYVDALEQREKLVKNLNLDNIRLLGTLHDKAQEVTILGRLLAINQGVRSKIVDRLNYLGRINSFVNNKLQWGGRGMPGFDIIRFLSDPDYNEKAVEAYERKKDTFNVLDVINTTPHFKAMLTSLVATENVPNSVSVRSKMIPKIVNDLRNRVPHLIEGNLTGRHISAINNFLSDIIISNYLDTIQIPLTNVERRYVGNDLLASVEEEQNLNLAITEDRMTFKNWFETTFLNELQREYPDNTFIQDLGRNYYRNRVSGNIYTLLRLPINLDNVEKESNELRYGNYLKDFNKLRYVSSKSNPMHDIGNLFFLYNLIVNKNKPGEYSLTRIFQDYLKPTNEEEMEKVTQSYAVGHLDYETSFMFGGNDLVEGRDYDLRDLAVRLLPNNTSITVTNNDGSSSKLIKKLNQDTKKYELTHNREVLKLKGEDNTTDLPFLKSDYEVYKRTELRDALSKLLNLYTNNNLKIKLNCD